MAKKKKSTKKRKKYNIFFRLLLIGLVFLLGYTFLTRILLPVYHEYFKKPTVIEKEELPQKEEEEMEIIKEEEMVETKLYFSDIDAMYLVAEKRKIPKDSNLAKQIIIELVKGPNNSNHYPTIPENTIVNEVYISDDIVYVDLSETIVKNHSGGSSSELMTVYSLVNSLTEIPSIKGVQILVEGKQRESLTGHIDISMPLLRDEDWINP